MYSGTTIAIVILSVALAGLASYVVGKWLFKKDTEVENRRRAAGTLASELSKVGLTRLPAFLIDYSVGDYSTMAEKIKHAAEMATGDPAVFMKEFEGVFARVLDAKLATADGRTLIAAKLADATTPTVAA